jgi:hypothetical protein
MNLRFALVLLALLGVLAGCDHKVDERSTAPVMSAGRSTRKLRNFWYGEQRLAELGQYAERMA